MSGVKLPHIAFIGKAGAGKSTVADILVERFGYEKLSFAAPLKAGCATQTDRSLLQRVGAGVRELYEDFWVNLFLAEVARVTTFDSEVDHPLKAYNQAKIVVDDCRYPNEVQALKAHGFVIVRIASLQQTRIDRLKQNGKLQDDDQLNHESETALDEFHADYYLRNEGWAEFDLVDDVTALLNRVRS
jgi:adenylate kinase family enzyme